MAFRERRRTQFKQGQHGSSDGDGGHIGSRTVPAQKTNRIMYQHYQSESSLQSLTAVALLVASLSVPVESRPSYFNCGPWTAGGSLPSAMGSPTYNEAANNECEVEGVPTDYAAGETYTFTVTSSVSGGLGHIFSASDGTLVSGGSYEMSSSGGSSCRGQHSRAVATEYAWTAPDSGHVTFNAMCAKVGQAFLAPQKKTYSLFNSKSACWSEFVTLGSAPSSSLPLSTCNDFKECDKPVDGSCIKDPNGNSYKLVCEPDRNVGYLMGFLDNNCRIKAFDSSATNNVFDATSTTFTSTTTGTTTTNGTALLPADTLTGVQLTLAGVDLESLSSGTIAQLKADIIASILEVETHIAASDIVGVQLTTDSFGNTIATVIFSSRVPTERTNAIATRVAADAETGDFAPIVDGVAVTATDVVVAHTLATNNPTVEVTMPGVSLDEFSDEDKQSLHSALVLVLLADNSTRMDASDVVGITFTENEDGDMVAVLILSASTLLGRVEAAVAAIATEIEESSLINLVPGISDATGKVTVVSSTLVADVDDGGGEAVQFELAGISASSLDENDLAKLKADIINAIVGANAGMSRSELIGVEMRSGDDGELVATVRFGNSVDAATAVAAGNAFDHEVASGDVAISHIPGTRETDASAGGAIDVQVERKDGIIYEAIQFTFADSELGDLTANEEDDLRDSVIGQVYASAATISTADILGAEISTNNDGQTVAIVSFMNRQDGDTADILAKNLEELSESGRFDFPETKISQRPSTFETTNAIGEGTQTAFQFELDGNRLVSLSPTQQDDLKDSMLEAIFDSNPTLSRSQVIGVNLGTNAADGDTVVSVVLGSNVAANSPEAAISAAANALQAHLGLNTDLFADIFGEDGVSSSIAPVPPTVSVEHGTLDAFGFEAVTFTIDNV
eukprot:gene12465-28332_t